ncbi:MAG TPA: Crp/Fnr family transcriptional regulator [Caulobacteraceae bacterium]|nr:Crp/Fnr family transcriptional regulator [Caulobacteraceae bacterium]
MSLDRAVRSLGLQDTDAAVFASLFASQRTLAKSELLTDEGARSPFVSILVDGFAQAVRVLADGRQQCLALFLPGDCLDLTALVLGRSSAATRALTLATVAQARMTDVQALITERPQIGRALWRATALRGIATEEWLVGLGRRSAFERLAHLMCEVMHRMRAAGLASHAVCDFPLTQTDLADMLGLSCVHVNRMVQQLRAEGLIQLGRGRLTICDEPRLTEAGGFQADYLGRSPPPARKTDETFLLRYGLADPA